MSASTRSPSFIPGNQKTFYNFQGIDRSKPRQSLDTGQNQVFWQLVNGHCNWRGILQRDPALTARDRPSGARVDTVKFYAKDQCIWAERRDGGISIGTDRNHFYPDAYGPSAVVTMAYFRGRTHVMSAGQRMLRYDGGGFSGNASTAAPGFGVAISRRLAVAGFLDRPTEVWLSRVDNEDVFPQDEQADTTEATKAGFIDLVNLLGTADEITGLGAFEVNRLAIFTNDQTIIYLIDPDFEKWEVDQRANIRVGCISHRTIVNVGSDLLYCSRHGVHAVSRSNSNGISIMETTLSYRIEDLYREMVRSVRDLTEINSTYDPDLGLYHIFFPQPDGIRSRRLTLNLAQGYELSTWSQGDSMYARCGDSLAGRTVFGTPGGLYQTVLRSLPMQDLEDARAQRGELDAWTPVLWHGSMSETKQTRALAIQASGEGELVVGAFDEEGSELTSFTLVIDATDDEVDQFPDVPLSRTYELPFMHRYRGLQLRFQSTDVGDIRITGFMVQLVTEK